ncbi:hypothetical protein VHEMI07528 [[Torrubiella] hemipterigena]|uniref:Zn(2)-C6 fungal-type domain-containing protein n=1 Tax=[Torrubiella] hemipterigena TaxID=1531966 RepID=A0A0A1TLI3_9HYPO|nr:hypothetical protein VHEMI07528 [[Torrubiella] hemipterigena]
MNPSVARPLTPAGGAKGPKTTKSCIPCRARKVKCDAAVVGLPCSSCTSRQIVHECLLPVRKDRARKSPSNPTPSRRTQQAKYEGCITHSATPKGSESPHKTEPDLLYLGILNNMVKDSSVLTRTTASTPYGDSSEESNHLQSSVLRRIHELDDVDHEYLTNKGVHDLPPHQYLHALIKTYFDHVYPFAPVINRVDFIRAYQSGNCSLFLLYAILAPASVHTSDNILSACAFESRSAAQQSFFSKARLLYDLETDKNPLIVLQGAIILCMVILDKPSDRDFGYWFHTAIRLATKINLRTLCARQDIPQKLLRLYRRIWWALYSLDIFHVFINTRRSRLLENAFVIPPRTEDDWEEEDGIEASSGLLSPVTAQQRASPILHCELSRIFEKCLSLIKTKSPQDPRPSLNPLDAWRKSLAAKMHINNTAETDVYYLNMQAMSYRLECILFRVIRHRWPNTEWSDWPTQRLRAAILELDTIAMRVLAKGTIRDFPISFITTMMVLLAMHIESAFNPAETELVQSMSRISISQTMLLLNQGRDIPVLKRALPVFGDILAKKGDLAIDITSQSTLPPRPETSNTPDMYFTTAIDVLHSGQPSNNPTLYEDLLGLDFMDDWKLGDWIQPVEYDMTSPE